MGYPSGVSLAVITAGTVSDFFGGDAGLTAKVTPLLGGTSHLVHAASGSVLVPSVMTFKADPGEGLSFSVPHVNQSGWLDGDGRAFQGWAYRVEVAAGKGLTWSKTVAPVIGQDLIDLDLVGTGGTGTPVVGPVPTVVSVLGKTGAITAQDLIDAGLVGGGGSMDLQAAKDYSDSRRWLRPPLSVETAGQPITTSGVYPVGSTAVAEALGVPEPGMGMLEHHEINSTYAKQTFIRRDTGKRYHRSRGTGGWGAWGDVNQETLDAAAVDAAAKAGAAETAAKSYADATWGVNRFLVSGDNLNTVRATGVHVASTNTAASGITNWPNPATPQAGALLVTPLAGGRVQQMVVINSVIPRVFFRAEYSTNTWADWEEVATSSRVPSVAWASTRLTSGANLNTLYTPGIYGVWFAADMASIVGKIPVDRPALVRVEQTVNLVAQTVTTIEAEPRVYVRYVNKTGTPAPGAWQWINPPAPVIPDIPEPTTSGSGLKRVPLSLTRSANGATVESISAAALRFPVSFGAPVARWRVHVSNWNHQSNTGKSGAVSFTGLWFGEADTNGVHGTAPAKVESAFTTPSNGSEYVTGWINHPMDPGKVYALSAGFTTASGQENWKSLGSCWRGTNPASANGTATPGGASNFAPFDWWIEAETPVHTPVVAGWGDSITSGSGTSKPVYDSWLSQYARSKGALPVHYSYPGSMMNYWTGPTDHKWHVYDGYDLARPDSVIHFMGQNDLLNAASSSDMAGRFLTTLPDLRAAVADTVYLATITPSSAKTADQTAIRRTYNTWLAKLPGGAVDAFDFADAVDDGTDSALAPEYDSGDGLHPTTAANAAMAAAVARPVTSGALATITDVDSARGKDTGWRVMPALTGTAADAARPGKWMLRRRDERITCRFIGVGVKGSAAGFIGPNAIPAGFTMYTNAGTMVEMASQHQTGVVSTVGPSHKVLFSDNDITWRGIVSATGTISTTAPTDHTGLLHGEVSWLTDDAWPNTLPGTAA